ncbi:MAG: hypothetical protein RR053_07620 [Evtepia sp.]
MKITKRDQNLLLVLAGLVIFFLGYLFVYNTLNTKTDALQSEIDTLRPTLEELHMHEEKLPEYKAVISDDQKLILEQQSRYPNHARPEDLIMYALELQAAVNADPANLSFSDPVPMMELSGLLVDGDALHFTPLSANVSTMTINCQLNYTALKSLIDYLYASDQRTSLDSLSVSYDTETGSLSGAVTVNKFTLSGADDTYLPTAVPDVPLGNTELFGGAAPALPN